LHHLISLQAERVFTFWVTGISTAADEKRKEETKFSASVDNLNARNWAKIKSDAARERMTASKSLVFQAASSPVDARGLSFEEDSGDKC
jgi:hypothetical protein